VILFAYLNEKHFNVVPIDSHGGPVFPNMIDVLLFQLKKLIVALWPSSDQYLQVIQWNAIFVVAQIFH